MPYASKKKANECRRRMYRRRRDALLALLSDSCELCGSTENLTIEHPEGRDYSIRELSSFQRVKKYLEEFMVGVKLAVRCLSCNSSDGNYWSQFYEEQQVDRLEKEGRWPPLYETRPPDEEPIDEDLRAF